jgi:hypothetical protein
MDTTMNITRTDLRRPQAGARRVTHTIRPDALPSALFAGEVIARALPHVVRDEFQGAPEPGKLAKLASPVLIRTDSDADEVEAFVRLHGGEIALVDNDHGLVTVEVAAETHTAAAEAVRALRAALETEAPDVAERVSLAFWMRCDRGGRFRHREIDAPRFDEIARNYTAPVRAALERLMVTRAPERGRLILWRGEPGTGKSHALRALARAWMPWCSVHFIMDPEELLAHGGAYMLDLLSWEDDDESRWRLLILEDAGELIAADARAATGQALSRLLNVADGLLGQGTRTLLLITTNEPVKRLHPAARRPGRCLVDIEFAALTKSEANAWLEADGQQRRVTAPTPLAELWADSRAGAGAGGDEPARGARFGFARALDER